jgi:hypothetical protein
MPASSPAAQPPVRLAKVVTGADIRAVAFCGLAVS